MLIDVTIACDFSGFDIDFGPSCFFAEILWNVRYRNHCGGGCLTVTIRYLENNQSLDCAIRGWSLKRVD